MNQQPNILWFCTDQQRFDTIGALNNPYIHTPNLDRLVREGVAFNRAYAQSTICSPSRASFLTGRYPRTTRVTKNGAPYFPQDEVLVTKLLAEDGYDCGLIGKLHLSGIINRIEPRNDDGYRVFKWSPAQRDAWPIGHDYQLWLKRQGIEWKEHYKGRNGGIGEEYHQTTWATNEAIDFIRHNSQAPWLLSVNVYDPHEPFDPPKAYQERYNAKDMPLPKWKNGELDRKPAIQMQDYLNGGQGGVGPSCASMSDLEKQQYVADYYAMIELVDHNVGRLLDELERTGQRENTVIVFMSDHGEMLGDHGLILKGGHFYEGLVHVPLIISWPGRFEQNLQSDALVELVDIAPTLLELAGLEVPYYMQGKSLLSILRGEADPHQHKNRVYCEYYYGLLGSHDHVYGTMYYDGRYKLVVYHGEEMGELYDHDVDPDEYDNLWQDARYTELKLKLMKESFDTSVFTLDPKPPLWLKA